MNEGPIKSTCYLDLFRFNSFFINVINPDKEAALKEKL